MSNSGGLDFHPHVALLPSAGMGHLTPFLRLGASLVHQRCRVTLITPHRIVSRSESQHISNFLSAFPQVTEKKFHALPFDPTSAISTDPFFLRREAIRCSAHLLTPILSSTSPPLSALITDASLFSSVLQITMDLNLPNYILFTSSARMWCFVESYPAFVASKTSSGSLHFDDDVEIPGLPAVPMSSVPPLLLDQSNLFAPPFVEDVPTLLKSNGVLINTFEALEAYVGVQSGRRESEGVPLFYPVGPLLPCEFEKSGSSKPLKWLDDQQEGSVVYVSFGSRVTMSREQMKELGNGLVNSGCRFLWVVNDNTIDKEDGENLDKVLGLELLERLKRQGLVTKGWVDQEQILAQKAIGGFVSHGGWNSLVEAAWHGVHVLVWPQSDDQKINAEAVEQSGLVMWVKSWGWGTQVLAKGDEIGEQIKAMMGNGSLRERASLIGEEARKAVAVGGSSEITLKRLTEEWKKNRVRTRKSSALVL